MAAARQCDRCRQFYTENRKNSKLSKVVKGVTIENAKNSDGFDKYFDLCDDCMTDFLAFIYDYEPKEIPPETEEETK